MMTRRMQKTYLAIVAPGAPVPEAGEIVLPLARREIGREAYVQVVAPGAPGAQSAVTRYRTLRAGPESALVELSPRTGRMHQLRVHMASIGSPILGDARYGGLLVLAGQKVPRLMLHALSLRFPHPSGGWMRVEAPPPSDFQGLADAVSK